MQSAREKGSVVMYVTYYIERVLFRVQSAREKGSVAILIVGKGSYDTSIQYSILERVSYTVRPSST